MCSDDRFLDGSAPRDVVEKERDDPGQIKPAIGAIFERGEATLDVCAALQRMQGTVLGCLEIAENGVGPLELWQVAHLSVSTAAGTCTQPAAATAANQLRTWCLEPSSAASGSPLPTFRSTREGSRWTSLVSSIVGGLDYGRKQLPWCGVPSVPVGLVAVPLAAQIPIIKLDDTAQLTDALLLRHGASALPVQQPHNRITHPQLALKGQRRQPGLRQTGEVDRKEPNPHRQLGVLHWTARGQRGTISAAVALQQDAGVMADDAVGGTRTARATNSCRLVRSLDRLATLPLGI